MLYQTLLYAILTRPFVSFVLNAFHHASIYAFPLIPQIHTWYSIIRDPQLLTPPPLPLLPLLLHTHTPQHPPPPILHLSKHLLQRREIRYAVRRRHAVAHAGVFERGPGARREACGAVAEALVFGAEGACWPGVCGLVGIRVVGVVVSVGVQTVLGEVLRVGLRGDVPYGYMRDEDI
jgi:hypothetical protein